MKFVLTFNTVFGQINPAITDYRLTENSPQHINSYCKKKQNNSLTSDSTDGGGHHDEQAQGQEELGIHGCWVDRKMYE